METKPGYLTTEFWITVITWVINFLNIIGIWDFISNWHSGILVTAVTFAYAVARGVAKQGVPYTPPAARR